MAKVLVVDDELTVRELLRRSLEAEGHVVIEGEDGAEGLEKFQDEKPDIVFLDIKMPRMNGIEALRKIRETDSEAKVIMLTALDDIPMERHARELGALDFLRKGIGFEAFIAVARRLLARAEREAGKELGALGRILVADDDPSVREILKRFLEEKGYEVETAADGNEALEKAKRYCPQVMITDIRMPGPRGLEMIDELRQSDPRMGIIVITRHPHLIQEYPALKKWTHNFILKPLNLEYLETCVLPKVIMMIA